MICAWHICRKPVKSGPRGPNKFCGKRCKNKYYVDRRRTKMKNMALEYKGGKCEVCGYCKSTWALQFHHTDPETKDFQIGSGNTYSWDRTKQELDKCVLVCANCHLEIHEKWDIERRVP